MADANLDLEQLKAISDNYHGILKNCMDVDPELELEGSLMIYKATLDKVAEILGYAQEDETPSEETEDAQGQKAK